jgi:glutamyl-tRNA synthetase
VPTYNFACVVDDHDMQITHVIRAEEHLSNTPSQMRMYEALGWTPPAFAHLSMILGPDGSKLSKRHGATSVQEYRDQGYLPEALRNYLALLGWATPDSQDLFGPGELERRFDLDRCQKNPATFDQAKLLWMNGEYLRRLSPEQLVEKAATFLEKAGLAGVPKERLVRAVALEREKVKLLSEVPKLVDFFFKPVEFDGPSVEKVLQQAGARKVLEGLLPEIRAMDGFTRAAIEARLKGYAAKSSLKNAQVFHPVRVAVSGRTKGPSLFEMLELLGKDAVADRIQAALPLAA